MKINKKCVQTLVFVFFDITGNFEISVFKMSKADFMSHINTPAL